MCIRDRFSDDSPIGIACEVCGATIRTGRYCERCKNDLANRLGGMYGSRSSTVDADKIRAVSYTHLTAQRAYELCSKAITTSDTMMEQANNLKR